MLKTLPTLVLLAVVPPLAAAPKIVGSHEVQPGGFAVLDVEGAGKTVIWSITPEPIQDREFSGTLVFTGRPGIDYTATAIIIDFEKKTAEKLKHTVRFLGDPSPPVPPGPDPPRPDPPTPVGPVKYVVVIEETADAAANRGAFFADAELQKKFTAGLKWRVVDKDVIGPDGRPPSDVQRFLDEAVGKPLPRLYLLDVRGKVLFSGNVPSEPARLVELLIKYGG